MFNYLLQIALSVYNSWIKTSTNGIKITSSDNTGIRVFKFKDIATIKKIFIKTVQIM